MPARQRPDQFERAIQLDAGITPSRFGFRAVEITGIRSCTKRTSRLAAVVMIEPDMTGSPAPFGVAVVYLGA